MTATFHKSIKKIEFSKFLEIPADN